jgi:hypothetical protein
LPAVAGNRDPGEDPLIPNKWNSPVAFRAVDRGTGQCAQAARISSGWEWRAAVN